MECHVFNFEGKHFENVTLKLSGDKSQLIGEIGNCVVIPSLEATNLQITTNSGFAVENLLSDLTLNGEVPYLSIESL